MDQWSDEQTHGGYTLPTRFRAGWQLGEPDEFPFFFAQIVGVSYGASGA